MKKALLFVFLMIGAIHAASAQNCNTEFLGTKTLYPSTIYKYTPAPAGYLPVFINHVGRHGARHLTKDVNTTMAYSLLLQADSANALTAKGKQLEQMAIALQKIEHGSFKSISAEGKSELNEIGARMFLNYSNVFKGKVNLSVAVTKEIRTTQSAYAFLQGLNSKLPDTATTKFYNDDTGLRFYDFSPVYKKFEGDVDELPFKSALKTKVDYDAIVQAVNARVFNADFLSKLDAATQAKFLTDVFGYATIVYSLKAEIAQAGYKPADLDFNTIFTCDELQKLGLLDNADDYLTKGPGTDNDGIQVRVAAPLLAEFIKSADDFVAGGKYNACLHFAHAETIAPFAAILQINTADKATSDISTFNSAWKASKVIPLSSNITWAFYKKSGKPGYLVKILLNEKEVAIDGMSKSGYPYYKWADLRAFYINKLRRLNTGLDDNMRAYLQNLK